MKHGAGRYAVGCRCEVCRAANTARMRRYRAGERRQPSRAARVDSLLRALINAEDEGCDVIEIAPLIQIARELVR